MIFVAQHRKRFGFLGIAIYFVDKHFPFAANKLIYVYATKQQNITYFICLKDINSLCNCFRCDINGNERECIKSC